MVPEEEEEEEEEEAGLFLASSVAEESEEPWQTEEKSAGSPLPLLHNDSRLTD